MNRAAIQQLYEPLDFAWRQFMGAVTTAGGDTLSRPAPGSGWPSLQDCLGHIIFAYDRWLWIMAGRAPTGIAERAKTLAEIDEARVHARAELDVQLSAVTMAS